MTLVCEEKLKGGGRGGSPRPHGLAHDLQGPDTPGTRLAPEDGTSLLPYTLWPLSPKSCCSTVARGERHPGPAAILLLLIIYFGLACSTQAHYCPGYNTIVSDDGIMNLPQRSSTVKPDCCPSPQRNNNTVIHGITHNGTGSMLMFECKNGFVLAGTESVTCEINCEWLPPLPECKDPATITCPRPTAPKNMTLSDAVIGNTTFPYDSQVTFECIAGYVSTGGSQISTCTSAGTWTPVTQTCKRTDCGSLGVLQNGTIHYPTGTLFGDKAVANCNLGYKLIGQKVITCGVDGWTSGPPVCEEVKCDRPPAVANGTMSGPVKEVYAYGDVVAYACKKGFALVGMRSLKCLGDGKFHPAPPSCIFIPDPDVVDPDDEPDVVDPDEVKCDRPPAVANGTMSGPIKEVYAYGDVVAYACKKGFALVGIRSLTCLGDGKFHPAPPSCIFIPDPGVVDPDDEPDVVDPDDDEEMCSSWSHISLLSSSSLIIAFFNAAFAYMYIVKKKWSFRNLFTKPDREL